MDLGGRNDDNDLKQDRKKVREVLCGAFEKFEGELAGKFYDLGTLSDEDRNMLLSSGFLFQIPKTTNLLWHAGAAKNWPTVRNLSPVGRLVGARRSSSWLRKMEASTMVSPPLRSASCKHVTDRFHVFLC